MINKIIIAAASLLFFAISSKSQDDSMKTVSIRYNDLDMNIVYNNNQFFTGVLSVSRNGEKLYSIDSIFSDYVGHDELDMNGDGSKELLLYCTDGASPYIFQNLFMFDIKRGDKPVYFIPNGYLDTTTSAQGRILVHQRLSPAVLGLWYYWLLEYKNNMLVLPKLDKKTKNFLMPDIQSITENLNEFYLSYSNSSVCNDGAYTVFFENVFISNKIIGEQEESEEYFRKNYKCSKRKETLDYLIKLADDTYKYIKNNNNYTYSEY